MPLRSVRILQRLRELIAALDRRRPQEQRTSEAAIATESAELRKQAVERIAEIEGARGATPRRKAE